MKIFVQRPPGEFQSLQQRMRAQRQASLSVALCVCRVVTWLGAR